MQMRRKLVFALLAVLFIMGVIIHVRLSMTNNSQQLSEIEGRWYNYTLAGDEDLNGPKIRMDDPRLVAKIRRKFLLSPSPHSVPYKLNDPGTPDPSMGQAQRIMSILGEQKGGFFVECGALDGETRSNSLVFERHLNWTGLLIEADPINFGKMALKNRKAWLSPTCLSIRPYPMMVSFKQAFNVGKISEYPPGYKETGFVDVECLPLYSYMLALNRTTIDYFSLDVEGNEFEVLKTIPFEKLDIRTMSVEYIHVDDGKDALRKFVENQGYILHSEVTHENNLANDFIFIKSSVAANLA